MYLKTLFFTNKQVSDLRSSQLRGNQSAMWRWQNLFFATCQKAPWAWRADIICCKIMCLSNTVSQRHNQFFFSAHFRYRHLMLMAPKYPHNCRYVSPVLRQFLHFFYLKQLQQTCFQTSDQCVYEMRNIQQLHFSDSATLCWMSL